MSIFERVMRCVALEASDNDNEAVAASRLACKLIRKHNLVLITQEDLAKLKAGRVKARRVSFDVDTIEIDLHTVFEELLKNDDCLDKRVHQAQTSFQSKQPRSGTLIKGIATCSHHCADCKLFIEEGEVIFAKPDISPSVVHELCNPRKI